MATKATDGNIPANSPAPRDAEKKRRVGRPRRVIALDQVADVAAQMYAQLGYDAVSIEAVAEQLGVSRATLYRTVRSMDELHTILFERSAQNVEIAARELLELHHDSREALVALITFQIDASIRMREYVGVYFGWGLPPDAFERWRQWAGAYERLWSTAVERAAADGHIDVDDPLVATRLMLGMVNWVSRWYRADGPHTAESIAAEAIRLVLPNR